MLEPLKAIYRYDFAIELLTKLSGFDLDLDVFRPNITECEEKIKDMQEEMIVLYDIIQVYKKSKVMIKSKYRSKYREH